MLRVGIVGCGLIAGGPVREGRPIAGNHAEVCRSIEGVTLFAAADPDAGRREAFGRQWGVTRLYRDLGEMLAAGPLDLVIVATPPEKHEAICLQAIERGVRGVFCEKPFTGASASAKRVVLAAQARGVPVAVNFTRRWDPVHKDLARRLASGEFGELQAVTGHYTGTLRGNGSHLVDTLRMLAPGPWQIDWVSSLLRQQGDAPPDGPASFLLSQPVPTPGGSPARFSALPVVGAQYFIFEIVVVTTSARVRLLFGGNDIRIDRPAPHPAYPGYRYLQEAEVITREAYQTEAFGAALSALCSAVSGGRPLSASGEDTLASLDLIDAIAARTQPLRDPL